MNGKTVTTQWKNFTPAMKKAVAGFDKSYTDAVNRLASHPNSKATVTINGHSRSVRAGFVAKQLAGRTMVAVPGLSGGMTTDIYGIQVWTDVYSRSLSGTGSILLHGRETSLSPDVMREIELAHEGMHNSHIDQLQMWVKPDDWESAHQGPYDNAAQELLWP